jgi:hypothetical protein
MTTLIDQMNLKYLVAIEKMQVNNQPSVAETALQKWGGRKYD